MRKKNKFYFKILTLCILAVIVIFILIKLLRSIFLSSYFNLQSIVTSQADIKLDYLKGQNIFRLNLKAIFERLTLDYPQYRIIRLTLQPPNQLIVKSEKRMPLAYLRLHRDFAIDSEGVLFYPLELIPDLPVIYGLESKIGYVKSGQKLNIKQIQLALQLIQGFNLREELKKYKLRRINLEGFGLTFYIDGIEVKIDDRISEGLVLLSAVLSRATQETSKLNYIDLRFKDPIVKYEK